MTYTLPDKIDTLRASLPAAEGVCQRCGLPLNPNQAHDVFTCVGALRRTNHALQARLDSIESRVEVLENLPAASPENPPQLVSPGKPIRFDPNALTPKQRAASLVSCVMDGEGVWHVKIHGEVRTDESASFLVYEGMSETLAIHVTDALIGMIAWQIDQAVDAERRSR